MDNSPVLDCDCKCTVYKYIDAMYVKTETDGQLINTA